jgi:nucleoside 2-deoxyribosyltransferase
MSDIETSVSHLQWLFTTVMALAIAEGLKQFVREIKDPPNAVNAPVADAVAGNAPVADAVVGNAPVADAVVGNAPVADAVAVGNAAVGNAVVGNAVVGNLAVGNLAVGNAAAHPLRWECAGGLLAFLVTAMPFTYGMTRYFFEAYKRAPLGEAYFGHLSFDSFAFTIEALSFFVMSRSLVPARSLTFAVATLVVFLVDIAWVLKCKAFGLPSGVQLDTWWIVQDPIVAAALIVSILGCYHCYRRSRTCLHVAVCVILGLEALVDLPLNWRFYFPVASEAAATIGDARKSRIYFAGPLFTQAEWRWNERLIDALRKAGYDVIAPQEQAAAMLAGKAPLERQILFNGNIEGIERCSAVIAILDGVDADSGTAWECGYAYKKGRPVVGVRTDLRGGGDDPKSSVNLMLSHACKELITLPVAKREDEALLIQKLVEALKRVEK